MRFFYLNLIIEKKLRVIERQQVLAFGFRKLITKSDLLFVPFCSVAGKIE